MNQSPRTDQLAPHQFKPGQSGNPSGRPKKLPVTDYVREQLEAPLPQTMLDALKAPFREIFCEIYGERPTFGQMIAFKLIQSSAKGDMFAMRELLERAEGKVTQKIAGDDGGPIVFTLRRTDRE